MSQRIIVIGGVAAGASAAAKARRVNEEAEILVVEAGPYISFANCGLPYYIGGEITKRENLLVFGPDLFYGRFGVDVRTGTEAVSISRQARTVTLRGPDGSMSTEHYDRLVLATGAEGIAPPIENLDGPEVFYCRTIPDVDGVMGRLEQLGGPEGKRAMIVGGGYIGLECAEQLLQRGMKVTVVELLEQVMSPLDPEMAWKVQEAFENAGGEVVLGDGVAKIERNGGAAKAVCQSGREVEFDLAIVGVGVRPNVTLAERAGLRLGPTGAISVDPMQRTSDPNIYAAGDNCESLLLATQQVVNIPLAGPANKQGRIAGANAAMDLMGLDDRHRRRLRFKGVLGTAGVRVSGENACATGINEKHAVKHNIPYRVTYLPGNNHAGYYPGAESMLLKILWEPQTGRLLGAQATGGEGVAKRIDVIATAIYAGLTVEDLEQLDLVYAPPFGAAKDVAILAGFAAANALRGESPGLSPVELVESLDEENPPAVLDVRNQREWDRGHLDEAVHIPVDEIRKRMDEIPRNGEIAVHCAGGYRSYVAQRILMQHGFENVRNVYGGYGMIKRAKAAKKQ